MIDTDPKMEAKLREMMMKRSPEDRMMMGFSMFDFAKSIVKSSILAKNKNISPRELRKKIFLRFYGRDFHEKARKTIANYFLNL